ncbi:MAG: hypothetical protein B6I20_02990 [Bacteroidetes bacterium 4572_117]|nr:MAG: hypothetical protein B6I20_02990 [Bacteroidetes bacterium 4572_117]
MITTVSVSAQNAQNIKLTAKAKKILRKWENVFYNWGHLGKIRIDSVSVLDSSKQIEVYFSNALSYMPVRESSIKKINKSLQLLLEKKFKAYDIVIFSGGYEYKQLIPNSYRSTSKIDTSRVFNKKHQALLINKVNGLKPNKGLYASHIALWHSHGWYYESKFDRWEWQRARLFGTVEDISPMGYVLPYITPMLENAGATVFLPRERDTQLNEVIVDADGSSGNSEFTLHADAVNVRKSEGFALKDTLFTAENPFKLGSSFFVKVFNEINVASYLPDIPEKGEYSVHISYQQNALNNKDVTYTVNHTGGSTKFIVNQTMGGGTWIYLGTFIFDKGKNNIKGNVEVSCTNGQLSLDAIRFGGGMGNIARRPANEVIPNEWSLKTGQKKDIKRKKVNPELYDWKTSQRPRYIESARYWLQYAGMTDSIVYNLNKGKNDYNDDYKSRGEWVNYLMGAPNGPTNHKNLTGLNIPIDLVLAFHTDAGVRPKDSIVGTLSIYNSIMDNGVFPNGKSRLASRDLTDIIHTQIVDDIHALHNPKWTRRAMWNRPYSEAWRPNVPAMLLELLSHQNLSEVKFGLDPRFRFDVSRAIYKGILKFQAFQEGRDFVVQPLPVNHVSIQKINKNEYELSWKPVNDPLEPTAKPTQYKVYQRIDANGFDNGKIIKDASYRFLIHNPDQILSFKVTAVNNGGESMPSEILSVCRASGSKPTVLIVNAFDRICGPAIIDNKALAGIAWWDDEGVTDKKDIAFCGRQYDFDRKSEWLDDDSPGWGASYGDMEGKPIPGNTFDFVYTHGEAILAAGYSFISVSDEAFNTSYDDSSYSIVDVVLGEEKTTIQHKDTSKYDFSIFSPKLMDKLAKLTGQGKHIMMTGAYVGTDLKLQNDSTAIKFAGEVLHYKWRTNHAVKSGNVYTSNYAAPFFNGNLNFNTTYNPNIYTVEAPDAIEPFGKDAYTAWRYTENNSSAGVFYNGKYKTVIMGFPFETIVKKEGRNKLMKLILDYFTTKAKN